MIKKYWPEIVVFGIILAVLVICCAPAMTYINTDSDGAHYTYSAKYLYPSHHTSAPLYLLLSHFVLYIPLGTEFWRMAMIAVLSTLGASWFIYLSVRHHTGKKWAGLIAALIYATGALVLSQSTIVDTYAFITFFAVGAYYYILKKRYNIAALFLGLGTATHLLIWFSAIVMFLFYRGMRRWQPIVIMLSFLAFYLYIPLTNRAPYIWQADPATSQLGKGIFTDVRDTIAMLCGTISQWEIPKRFIDTMLILLVSFGVGVIPIVYFFKSKPFKEPLLWLVLLPIILFATDLSPQTYVYLIPGIAFGCIALGRGLAAINRQWAYAAVAIPALGLAIFNANYFDIGRTLDPQMSAQYYYDKELPKVPDGAILLTMNSFEWPIIFKYNEEHDRHIIPVCAGALLSPNYLAQLRKDYGINTPEDNFKLRINQRQVLMSYGLAEMNENVWLTYPIDARNYVMGVKPYVKGDLPDYIPPPSPNVWHFAPSNPYDFITGAIEITEWHDIPMSNRNALFYVAMGCMGGIPMWFVWQLMSGKKWRFENVREKARAYLKG